MIGGCPLEMGKFAEIGVLMRCAAEQDKRVPVFALFLNDELSGSHSMPGEEGIVECLQSAFPFVIRKQSAVEAIEADGSAD